MHGENYGHNHGNFFSKTAKKSHSLYYDLYFLSEMEKKMVIFSRIKHYLQMKFKLPLGSQAFFRPCTLLEVLADVDLAAGAW